MTLAKFFKASLDTLGDFRKFRESTKSHFNRPPSIREYIDSAFNAEEAREQAAYVKDVVIRADRKFSEQEMLLKDILFPTEQSVRKFLAYQGITPTYKIGTWSVVYSLKFVALQLHISFVGEVKGTFEGLPKEDYLVFGPISAFPEMVKKFAPEPVPDSDPVSEKMKKDVDAFGSQHFTVQPQSSKE